MDNNIEEIVEKFDYCISNPPYQDSSNKNSVQIYDKFWLSSDKYSISRAMIFPIGWQKSSGRGSGSAKHPFMRSDKSILLVDNYFEDKNDNYCILFPTVSTGGVNIVVSQEKYNNNGKVKYYEYGLYKQDKDLTDQSFWSYSTDSIFNKIDNYINDNKILTMKDYIPGRTPYGVRTYMVKKDREESNYFHSNYVKKSYKCWVNINNIYQWQYIDRNAPFIKNKYIDKYKLVFPITGAYRVWRDSFIINPNEIFSDTFINIVFDTRKEAENCQTYLKTLFHSFMITESTNSHNANRNIYKHVPDLRTIVNPRTGLVGYDSDWNDDDLRNIFKDVLDDSDWKHIIKTAQDADRGRA